MLALRLRWTSSPVTEQAMTEGSIPRRTELDVACLFPLHVFLKQFEAVEFCVGLDVNHS